MVGFKIINLITLDITQIFWVFIFVILFVIIINWRSVGANGACSIQAAPYYGGWERYDGLFVIKMGEIWGYEIYDGLFKWWGLEIIDGILIYMNLKKKKWIFIFCVLWKGSYDPRQNV